jgi:hypothetical protein
MSEPTNITTPSLTTPEPTPIYLDRAENGAVATAAIVSGTWVNAAAIAAAGAAGDTLSPRLASEFGPPKTIPAPVKPKIKRAPKHDFKDGRGRVFAHRHANGGGWVEDTAHVGADVYVGSGAQIMNNASVFGREIRIEAKAKVSGNASIMRETRVAGECVVSGKAVVIASSLYGECRVTGNAEVSYCNMEHAVTVCGSAHVRGSRCRGRVLIDDNAVAVATFMRGFIKLSGNSVAVRSTLEGLVEIRDFGQILRSCAANYQYFTNYLEWRKYSTRMVRPEFFICIAGSSTIQNDTNLSGALFVGGKSLIDNCRVHIDYRIAGSDIYPVRNQDGTYDLGPPRIERRNVADKKWSSSDIRSMEELDRLINDTTTNATGQMRVVRREELQSPYSLERMPNGRRIVPV